MKIKYLPLYSLVKFFRSARALTFPSQGKLGWCLLFKIHRALKNLEFWTGQWRCFYKNTDPILLNYFWNSRFIQDLDGTVFPVSPCAWAPSAGRRDCLVVQSTELIGNGFGCGLEPRIGTFNKNDFYISNTKDGFLTNFVETPPTELLAYLKYYIYFKTEFWINKCNIQWCEINLTISFCCSTFKSGPIGKLITRLANCLATGVQSGQHKCL